MDTIPVAVALRAELRKAAEEIAAIRVRAGQMNADALQNAHEVIALHAKLTEAERVIALARVCSGIWSQEMTEASGIAFALAFERLQSALTPAKEPRDV